MSFKHKEILAMVRSVADRHYTANSTLISLDADRGVIVDGFRKLIDFTDTSVNLIARNKKIYIYGMDIKITSFKNSSLYISGEISKIELYEVK